MDIKRIFADGLNLLLGKLGTTFIGIFNLMILSRIFSTQEMGKFSLFTMVVGLAVSVGLAWSETSIVRHGREEFVKTGKINRSFWARSAIFGPLIGVFTLLFIIFNSVVTRYIGVERWVILLVISSFILTGVMNYLIKIYQSISKMKISSYILLLQSFIFLIGLGLIQFGFFKSNITAIFILLNLSYLITIIINFFPLNWSTIRPYKMDRGYLKKIWTYSWPQLIGFSGLYIINYIDLFVIRKYMAFEDVGVYSVAYKGFTVVAGIIMLMNTLFMPLIVEYRAKHKHAEIDKYLSRLPLFATGWLIIVVIGISISDFVIPFLFSSKYISAVPSFKILLFSSFFYFISIYLLPLVNAYDLVKYSQAINIFKSIVNIVMDFILVPRFGIIGAAYGTLISYASGSVLSIILVNKKIRSKESVR